MVVKKYKTPKALLDALNHRLRATAMVEGVEANRLRRQVAFDRLLARIFQIQQSAWLLKGGYAMELRTQNSRATKDIDLALFESDLHRLVEKEQSDAIHKLLIQAASVDLDDYFTFEIGRAKRELFSPPYGGARYSVNAIVSNKSFVRFNIDIGLGDPTTESENLQSRNWLDFAGINCPVFPAISADQQFSDKLYVYTIPRLGVPSSRAKDLVDMVLLIQSGKLKMDKLRLTLVSTFACYKTHTLPATLLQPPSEWTDNFSQLANECKLEISLDQAFALVKKFYEKILSS